MSMGKVKVESIDDAEEMQIMDEAFDILGFTHEEKYDVYRISALCMQFSRLEFQGMGEVASPKSLDAGEHLNSILNFADSGEAIYDAFINPKFKVNEDRKMFFLSPIYSYIRLELNGSTRRRTLWL